MKFFFSKIHIESSGVELGRAKYNFSENAGYVALGAFLCSVHLILYLLK